MTKQEKIKVAFAAVAIVVTSTFLFGSRTVFRSFSGLLPISRFREIVVLTTKDTFESTASSLKSAGLSQAKLITLDSDGYLKSNQHLDNSTYVLIGSPHVFKVPQKVPSLPKKNMVIGYTFSQCSTSGYSLLLPDSLEGCMLLTNEYRMFIEFNEETLKNQYSDNEAFHIFTDFHSLHVLMLPCGSPVPLPSWESIHSVESDKKLSSKPWGKMETIPEIWRITDII